MSAIDDLAARVRLIATEIQNNIRINSVRPGMAGWGQFIAASHAHQIGPYGTCAALLAISIGHSGAPIDPRAVKQIDDFLSSGEGSKLYEQNVRLAFLVLSIGKIQDSTLIRIRDAVTRELRDRQLPDGSWGDWRDAGANPAPGRPETTAWVVLALGRLDPTDAAAIKGAEYISRQVVGTDQLQILSPVAIAAALSILPRDKKNKALWQRAHSLVQAMQVTQEEHIAFFDYVELSNTRVARDYLCFPAFYALSLLINGMLRHSHTLELPRLAVARVRAIESLTNIIGTSGLYRLPGARFAATVDQAMVALAYEQLAENTPSIDPFVTLTHPMWQCASNSIILRVVLPLFAIVCAIVTLQSPKAVPEAIQRLTGVPLGELITFADDNASIIQLAVAFVIALFPQLPSSVWTFAKRRLRL